MSNLQHRSGFHRQRLPGFGQCYNPARLISFARDAGIDVTVEGLETQQQQPSFISAGLPMNAQGYRFKAVSDQRAAHLLMVMAGSIVSPPATDAATLAIEDSHRPVGVAR
ncbi:hypothetical protein [Pseudomonas sp. DWP3-1-2]|uniref:hypothetical protein n=1 Tax=Pseudomonas sp. DWP3-1-2 TaxID=2804645 RepID=UPI003CF91E8C